MISLLLAKKWQRLRPSPQTSSNALLSVGRHMPFSHAPPSHHHTPIIITPTATLQGMMPRRQLSSRHRSTSLLRRGLGSPGPRPEGRHAVLGRLVGYIPSDDGSPSQAASSMARDTGAEGGAAEEAVLRGGREAAKQRGGSRAVCGDERGESLCFACCCSGCCC